MEHAEANCSACAVYDGVSKSFVGALSLHDVASILLYFKQAALQYNDHDHEHYPDPLSG